MKEITIDKNLEGYKLKKVLIKVLSEAPASFSYKMLRKKNITLNKKKATGDETVSLGDTIQFFLSDETFDKFSKMKISSKDKKDTAEIAAVNSQGKAEEKGSVTFARRALSKEQIIYQDEDVMLITKPVGVLSQKVKESDESINEMALQYLYEEGIISKESLQMFHPSVCNRLDRNTSGMVLFGISPKGSRYLSQCIRERTVEKYYKAVVKGNAMDVVGKFEATIDKDHVTNQVTISEKSGKDTVITSVTPVYYKEETDTTVLEIELITGKSHQIRAHMAYLGHPVVGDLKYGSEEDFRKFRDTYKVKSQLLHAEKVHFTEGLLKDQTFTSKLPAGFTKFVN